MSSKPTRTLRQDGDDQEHGKEEDALQNNRNPPRIARGMGRESIVDPIDEIGSKVQRRKLHADIQAPAGFWGELGLEHGDGRIDETHAASRHDSGDDDVCACVGCRLQERADDHDDDAGSDALSSAKGFADDGCSDGAEEASDCQRQY